jgi:hypothetical protein
MPCTQPDRMHGWWVGDACLPKTGASSGPSVWQPLQLTLSAAPYNVMVTGEKKVEFRDKSRWIESRLFSKSGEDKRYDRVVFANGYGRDKPRFSVSFKGYKLEPDGVHVTYSNGLVVDRRGEPTYAIFLGDDVQVEHA